MKPYTAMTVVLFMALVSVSLAGEDSTPEKGNCPRPHEEWTDCGPAPVCIRTCDNPDLNEGPCPAVCIAQCICEEGFIRKTPNGPCIRRCACPHGEHPDN